MELNAQLMETENLVYLFAILFLTLITVTIK